jgi:PadR family transcriptional regulator, regulatory protein PadR
MERVATFGLAAMNPGTFYRTLRQMEKEGMVRSSWDTSETGPARRMYSITEAGETYLKYWADSLNQYQRLMDTFFRLYTGRPSQKDQS